LGGRTRRAARRSVAEQPKTAGIVLAHVPPARDRTQGREQRFSPTEHGAARADGDSHQGVDHSCELGSFVAERGVHARPRCHGKRGKRAVPPRRRRGAEAHRKDRSLLADDDRQGGTLSQDVSRRVLHSEGPCVYHHRRCPEALDDWVENYNTRRPHQGVGGRPPAERFALARKGVLVVGVVVAPLQAARVTITAANTAIAPCRRITSYLYQRS